MIFTREQFYGVIGQTSRTEIVVTQDVETGMIGFEAQPITTVSRSDMRTLIGHIDKRITQIEKHLGLNEPEL